MNKIKSYINFLGGIMFLNNFHIFINYLEIEKKTKLQPKPGWYIIKPKLLKIQNRSWKLIGLLESCYVLCF